MRRSEKARFMSHVKKATDGCWLWTACTMANGYGQFTPAGAKQGEHELAHRASYRIFNAALDEEMDVMHSCDNPSCVNPNHLRLGTRADNMQDAKRKGRTARGEGHGRRKLTADQVREIRLASGSQREIADSFGIGQGQVSRIRSGARWASLGG